MCSRNLLNISSSQSWCGTKGNEKEGDVEIDQNLASGNYPEETRGLKDTIKQNNILEIESVEKSLGAVDISNIGKREGPISKGATIKKKKWTRRKVGKKEKPVQLKFLEGEGGKRKLVDVMITNGNPKDYGSGEKRLYQRWCWKSNTAYLNENPQ